ncbi:MAG: alpha-L-fucosidase precursor [Phycisphaeraceae bacterium]|nr:alpha-L-fucosidase precursor [Phycisphaeraceae bacterium]
MPEASQNGAPIPDTRSTAVDTPPPPIPRYLHGYEDAYAADPRGAAIQWFRKARFGLMLHYGPYSLPGRHEWLQLHEKIPVAEYAKLMDDFTAAGFDAEAICRLAVATQMRYVNITTRHHDSFCLWDTACTNFNSIKAPCGRDLIAELAEACDRHRLGLCLYYSHGRDWRHPHAPNNDLWGGAARPEYDEPQSEYATGDDHDLGIYVQFMKDQVTELLTGYGPIAAIWLDGIAVPLADRTRTPCPRDTNQPDNAPQFECQALYDHIHALQPQVLISYKQGLLGTEDFYSPELEAVRSRDKPGEVCRTMCDQPHRSYGYLASAAGTHMKLDDAMRALNEARGAGFNLLLNTAPRPDGSLDPEDVAVLEEMGRKLRDVEF